MKKIILVIITVAGINLFISCGNAETKADVSDTVSKKNTDTVAANSTPKPQDGMATRSVNADSIVSNIDKKNILANIDKYLVSKFASPVPGAITVQNSFTDISVQKIIVEVSLVKENGDEVRTDYYIMENIEPGGSKSVKINIAAQFAKANCHIIKLKSDELTDGELIMVGSKYVPK